MTTIVRRTRTRWIPLLASSLALAGCSGSGGAPSGIISTNDFALLAISVTDGQIWQINRPIRFTFNHSVDFDSVNLNTLSIQREGGLPAVGDFTLDMTDLDPIDGNSRSVIFQPVCPTKGDFSDAGFKPNGVWYQVDVPGLDTGATAIRSLRTGQNLKIGGRTLNFKTASSDILAELFLDPVLGPPTPLLAPINETACRVVVIDADTGELVSKEFIQNSDGSGSLEEGYLVPNNFYSDVETQITIYLEFNQAVSPTIDNISDNRLKLQYKTLAGDWVSLPIEVDLVANCTDTGSTVEMSPIGLLPQDREMRVVVMAQFEDLVGDRNIVPLDRFALMRSDAQLDHLGAPVETADEFLEPFNPYDNSFEDTTAPLDAPRGTWGDQTSGNEGLQATFAFDGDGGPGGEFDLKIRTGTEVVFDTVSTLFIGGPDFSPQFTQQAVNGRLDVRHLLIEEGGILRCQGPNPALIMASGSVTIKGTLSADGSGAAPVFTLNTPNQPEAGAAGQCGGGDGGTGSFLTNQVTPIGGSGFGAFQVANLGGMGGEAGWHPSNSGAGSSRRAGGGGGGRFGHDAIHYGDDNVTICPNEWVYGLNAESGFLGADLATSSQGPHKPFGGVIGASPFNDFLGTIDDFFGTKRAAFGTIDESLVVGELATPWAGGGGGAGGDATRADSYPPSELVYNDQDKGAGGGGGAGSLTIMALGNITVEGLGSITAIGGHGSGGENTSGVNRIGGGSGGGSGGHIILQSGQKVDLSNAFLGGESGVTKPEQVFHSINARGGQGGAGASNTGGADNKESKTRKQDAKHRGTDNLTDPQDNPWIPKLPDTCVTYNDAALGTGHKWVVRCAGGDGGPGLVQIHVGNLSGAPADHDIIYPADDVASMRDLVWPAPHGLDELEWVWVDQLLPSFGRFSKSQSSWIPLGAATVAPGTSTPSPLTFLFDGIDIADGMVESSSEAIEDLDPLLEPAAAIENAGLPERVSSTVVRFDAGELAGGNEVYARNPNLLRRFRLIIGTDIYSVASATYEGDGDLTTGDNFLDVTLTESIDVGGNPPTGLVTLVPRYFTVTTNGVADALPGSSSIKIEFQATSENLQGNPDEIDVFPGVNIWSTDIDQLTGAPGNTDFRFIRYRVTFDIAVIGDLDASTPRPVLDFIRFPFKF